MPKLMAAVTAIRDAQSDHEKAESYYEGTQGEVFASVRLQRLLASTGEHFRINFARVPVLAVLNRLNILGFSAVVPEDPTTEDTDDDLIEEEREAEEEAEASPVNLALQSIVEHNDLMLESGDFHEKAEVFGECYAIVWPGEEDDTVDILYNSPLTTRIFYDEENPRRKKYAAKVWVDDEIERVRLNLYYPDRIEKWVSRVADPKGDADFEPHYDLVEVDEETGEETGVWPDNPYGVVPVFHFRTKRPHGRPEHRDAYGPQDMVNKLVITQMASNDYHGFPQRYVLAGLTTSDEMEEFDDEEIDVDEAEASAAKSQEQSSLRSGPGELWWLTGKDLEVGQFEPGSVEAFLEPFREYVQAMATVTETPLHYYKGMVGAPSGESLRAAESPLIKKVDRRKTSFAVTWANLLSFALEVLGFKGVEVHVQWAATESRDDKDGWETAKAKLEAGVPQRQVLVEAGYTPTQVDEFLATGPSAAAMANATRVAQELGSAVQRLGVGVQLGVLTAEQAQAMIRPALPAPMDEEPAAA